MTVVSGAMAMSPRRLRARIEKHPQRASGDIEVFSPEEINALVRAATSQQDATIYLTAAFTGLRRGELLASRGDMALRSGGPVCVLFDSMTCGTRSGRE